MIFANDAKQVVWHRSMGMRGHIPKKCLWLGERQKRRWASEFVEDPHWALCALANNLRYRRAHLHLTTMSTSLRSKLFPVNELGMCGCFG